LIFRRYIYNHHQLNFNRGYEKSKHSIQIGVFIGKIEVNEAHVIKKKKQRKENVLRLQIISLLFTVAFTVAINSIGTIMRDNALNL
jgi:amino acid permease